MILSCTCNIRFTSELETSGKVTGIKSRDPSSNGGINSLPRLRIRGMLINKAMILIPMTKSKVKTLRRGVLERDGPIA